MTNSLTADALLAKTTADLTPDPADCKSYMKEEPSDDSLKDTLSTSNEVIVLKEKIKRMEEEKAQTAEQYDEVMEFAELIAEELRIARQQLKETAEKALKVKVNSQSINKLKEVKDEKNNMREDNREVKECKKPSEEVKIGTSMLAQCKDVLQPLN
eukprot:TRINITY_DN12293_c0_g1_i1.p2 TRINITY_DN12293_c0_g1~~TRINITY_DN12293_c0_g1_i1.p2  ORF type:complete len:156 (+),score=46.89 TRINITY_DN12293_c0_g1_i1:178-645(+)